MKFKCCKRIKLCIHRSLWTALAHPSVWAGFAGVLATTGAQLAEPYHTGCLIASALCSFMAIIIRTPREDDMMNISGDIRYGVADSRLDKK